MLVLSIPLLAFNVIYNTSIDVNISQKDHKCLSMTIFHESRGEPLDGQMNVAKVVMNRKNHVEFPDSVCDVVFQKRQFSWITEVNKKNWRTNSKTDLLAYYYIMRDKVYKNPNGVTFFSVQGFKNSRLEFVDKIGDHKFYRIVR